MVLHYAVGWTRAAPRPIRATVLVQTAVLALLLLAVYPGGPMLEWITNPNNAATVQAVAAVVQALFGVLLLVVTFMYVRLTSTIARETRATADASRDSARATLESYQARRTAPHIWELYYVSGTHASRLRAHRTRGAVEYAATSGGIGIRCALRGVSCGRASLLTLVRSRHEKPGRRPISRPCRCTAG